MGQRPGVAEIEGWLERLFVAAEGASLRAEDRRKAVLVEAMLGEIRRASARLGRRVPLGVVDAAAGKAYVGLLAARLVIEADPHGRPGEVVTIERETARVRASEAARAALDTRVPIRCLCADVGDPGVWPHEPAVVAALHACGPASDVVIERAITARARTLLLVPCCTSAGVPAAAVAARAGEALGVPAHAPVRRRFVQAIVDAERTLRLEAAGYETEVVELAPPTITPHNLLWRARRVGEPGRVARARAALERLRA